MKVSLKAEIARKKVANLLITATYALAERAFHFHIVIAGVSGRKIAIGVIAGAYFTHVSWLFLRALDECNDFYACIVRHGHKNQALKVVCCKFLKEIEKRYAM